MYALGVLLFHLLTGTHPVTGKTLDDVRLAHCRGERRRLNAVRPDVPASLPRSSSGPRRWIRPIASRARTRSRRRSNSCAGRGAKSASEATTIALDSRSGRCVRHRAAVLAALWIQGQSARAVVPFERRDSALIAAFDNRTSERELEGVVEAALEYELTNSRFITVLPPNRIDDLLRITKQKPADGTVTMTVARGVALRDGAIRVLVGGQLQQRGAATR